MKADRVLRAALGLALLAAPLAQAEEACRYAPIGKIDVLDNERGRAVVAGSINHQPARFSLNTGAFATRLSKTAAERLHLSMWQTRSHANGIGGASTQYAVKVDDVSVGELHSGRTEMMVLGNQPGATSLDGTLGADFLMQADVEFALAEKQVRFYRGSGCDNTYLAYWSPDAVELPFGGTYTRHANPRFIVEVNGVKLEAAISSSSPRSSITREAAARAGIKLEGPAGKVTGVGEDAVATWQVEADSVSLGSETIQHAHLMVLDTPPQGASKGFPDVSLGHDFLATHRVLIANGQRRFYISYLGGEVFPSRRVVSR